MTKPVKDSLARWLSGRRPLWGLDFDGTLVGIERNPDDAVLSAEGVRILEEFGQRHELAVITGRSLENLARQLQAQGVHAVGNHGGQIRLKQGTTWEWSSGEWSSWRQERLGELEQFAREREARFEDKGLTLTVHYRGSPREQWWETEGGLAVERFAWPVAQVMRGALSWNITPAGIPNKGHSALSLCRQLGCDSIVYFGDEETDENVFRLTEVPVFGVKVGDHYRGKTAAAYRVAEPANVLGLLREFR